MNDDAELGSEDEESEAAEPGGFRQPRARPQEQLLIQHLADLPGSTCVANSAGRGQFAEAFARARPDGRAVCWFLDAYTKSRAQAAADRPANLEYVCAADFPEGTFDLVALAFSVSGEAELARELLNEGCRRLPIGGRLAAAVDNPQDKWLGDELAKLFTKITRKPGKRGTIYWAVKTAEPKKVKDYEAEFAFRDAGKLVYAYSRPGVFGHCKLDLGARALLETMKIPAGARVLDLGCGSGALALATALRDSAAQVTAADSVPRALACTAKGAAKNGVADRVTTVLDFDGTQLPEGAFAVVLANPPYYSNNRLQEVFVQTALQSLAPSGVMYLVTKQPEWYRGRLPQLFFTTKDYEARGYVVFEARKAPKRRPFRP